MTTPKSDYELRRERVLAELLLVGVKDRIADISSAINKTFFDGMERNMGHVFLSNAVVARRGNLTEKMLFHDDTTGFHSFSTTTVTKTEEQGQSTTMNDRWVRGVLILSSSLLPPPESLFLNRQTNGRVLFDRTPGTMLLLLLRVVGVPLPLFTPHGKKEESVEWLKNCRQVLQETEHRFLHGLKACLVWLIRHRRREKMMRDCKPPLTEVVSGKSRRLSGDSSVSPLSTPCSGGNTNNSSSSSSPYDSSSFFSAEPPTLSVPLYYLSVHMEDNASSRISDIADLSSGFIDLMVDGELSVVKESTALLQGIVQLSNIMARLADDDEGKEDMRKTDHTNEKELDKRLHILHRYARSLLGKRCNHLPVAKSNKATSTLIMNPERDACGIPPISELQLDDSPVELEVAQHPLMNNNGNVSDDDYGNNTGGPSPSCGSDGGGNNAPNPRNEINTSNSNGSSSSGSGSSGSGGKSDIQPHPFPGVLVHCVKGISRSPSIIMAYYLRKYCADFYALSPKSRSFSVENDERQPGRIPEDECSLFSFAKLVECVREARPLVYPQVCFLAELNFMWERLSEGMAKEEVERRL